MSELESSLIITFCTNFKPTVQTGDFENQCPLSSLFQTGTHKLTDVTLAEYSRLFVHGCNKPLKTLKKVENSTICKTNEKLVEF